MTGPVTTDRTGGRVRPTPPSGGFDSLELLQVDDERRIIDHGLLAFYQTDGHRRSDGDPG